MKMDIITCGVAQGACLSPTLFNVYINDVPTRNSKNNENTLIFANDLGYLLFYKKKSSQTERKANFFLMELENWANMWRLRLAAHKCKYMTFTQKNANPENETSKLIINDTRL